MKGFREIYGTRRVPALAIMLVLTLALVAGCGGGSGSGDGGNGGGGGDTGGGGGTSSGGGGQEITVASNIAYPPFEFNEGGEPTGFDIDLMRAVAERAGYEVNFQNVRFDGIVQGLSSGQYDAAISAMTITPERQEQVAFSEPYFNADQSLLVAQGSGIESTDDLGEATVGVESGTTGALEAQELEEESGVGNVRTFNTVTDAFNALENGQIDAVINDFPVSQDRVEQSEGLEIVENIPTGEQYGIAFPQDSELVQPMNEALAEIKEDGTYAEIYEKWFGQEPEQIP
ncbi:basic amino acid ABC transporter substrate-binding protein [Rubrobacter aplysinae]|uniref:basic amino acid ABC transporter substrate-binding protein n=1 Tax=Rubrobacter aplysinae TaxID=909625 RepID=UPI00069D3F7A|nr:basic amino acid ABC transporter substrate-binding protein [Rubrobacter aplysinae]